jgi:hypothetical protein
MSDQQVLGRSVVLEKMGSRLPQIISDSRISAVLFIDCTGAVLASAGEVPLHPDQLGAIGAGICSAMHTMLKVARSEEFILRIPANNLNIQFHYVDKSLFLCGLYKQARDERTVRARLLEAIADVRKALAEEQTIDRRQDNVSYIEAKLNELFRED